MTRKKPTPLDTRLAEVRLMVEEFSEYAKELDAGDGEQRTLAVVFRAAVGHLENALVRLEEAKALDT